MEKQLHDTFVDLERGTPGWFTWSVRILPIGILGQFLSAGIALFQDGGLWSLHATVGGALSLPVVALACGALFIGRLRGFGWWVGLILLFYLIQIALAVGSTSWSLSFHPLNGALLLATSFVLLGKVERRRARSIVFADKMVDAEQVT